MGASGWSYFVPYEPDIAQALGKLRESVFRSGTFYTPMFTRKSKTIAELLKRNGESGTHSILDVDRVLQTPLPVPVLKWHFDIVSKTGSPPPEAEFHQRMLAETKLMGAVAPFSDEQLNHAFGTNRPTRNTVDQKWFGLLDFIPRGCGAFVIVYDAANNPSEIFFTGKTGD